MTLSPTMDARDQAANDAPARALPHNIEAEKALLGAVMYDNAAADALGDLQPSEMYEPGHRAVYSALLEAISKGRSAEPILLFDKVRGDHAFNDLTAHVGGMRYLADLVDFYAGCAPNIRDYARAIRDAAQRRELIRIGQIMINEAEGNLERPLNASEQIEKAEQALFALGEGKAQTGGFRDFGDCIDGFMDQAAKAMNADGTVTGLSTDLIDLDAKTGGLHPSDLVIVAGRPGSGKTALATNIAFAAARKGKKVAFFSLEMSGEQLAGRIISDVAGVSGDAIRKGDITPVEFGRMREAAQEIRNLGIAIDDGGGTSISKINARARRLKRTQGLDLVVVDYIQLSKGSDKPNQNRVQEVGEITGGLKGLAKDCNVPVIGLSQLSRQVEARDDKRPKLSDLRESGSIEQDADMVWFVYREAYYLEQAEPKEGTPEHFTWQEAMDAARGVAEVIIGKQRHGPVGTIRLSFDGETTRFGNLAREGRFTPGYRNPAGGDE